ncbi:unnamed protein product [Gordionus sp. m RMFG-2023]
MIVLCLIGFFASTCFSIIAPFFPYEAAKRNVDQFWSSSIFAIFPGIQLIATPLFAIYMDKVGIKRLYLIGIMLNAVSTLSFGFSSMISKTKSPVYFITFTILLRLMQGIGNSAFTTTSYIITTFLYPFKVATAFGIFQTSVGLGFALGPPIGAFLFTAGGYSCPFLVLGVVCIILSIIAIFSIPTITDVNAGASLPRSTTQNTESTSDVIASDECLGLDEEHCSLIEAEESAQREDDSTTRSNMKTLRPNSLIIAKNSTNFDLSRSQFSDLRQTNVVLNVLFLVLGAINLSFVDSSLELHVRSLIKAYLTQNDQGGININMIVAGIFFALSGSFTFSSLVMGALVDKYVLGFQKFSDRIPTPNGKTSGHRIIRFSLLGICIISSLALLVTSSPIHPFSLKFLFPLNTSLSPKTPCFLKKNGTASWSISLWTLIWPLIVTQTVLGASVGALIVMTFSDLLHRVRSPVKRRYDWLSASRIADDYKGTDFTNRLPEGDGGEQEADDDDKKASLIQDDALTNRAVTRATDQSSNSTILKGYNLVSSLFTFGFALGAFLGPLIGGEITRLANIDVDPTPELRLDQITYKVASTNIFKCYKLSYQIISGLNFAVMTVCAVITAYQIGKKTV